jgi:uncharacterized protein YggE
MSRVGIVLGAVGVALVAVVLVVQLLTMVPGGAGLPYAGQTTGITVTAQGKASGQPDLANITIGVDTRDLEASQAADQNDAQMAQVMAALSEMGIADEDIRTVEYSIRPEIDYEDDEQRVIGYVVNNSVLVKIRDVNRVGDVLDAVTEAGANNVYGIQFTFDDPSALRDEARTEAMAEAKKKAGALAELAGVRLGKPRHINESFTESPPYYLEPVYAMPERAAGGAAPVMPGELEISIQVQVTYDIG